DIEEDEAEEYFIMKEYVPDAAAPSVSVTWKIPKPSEKLKASYFFIGIRGLGRGFLGTHFPDRNLIAHIKTPGVSIASEKQNPESVPNSGCFFYKSTSLDVYFVLCNDVIPDESVLEWTESLIDLVDSKTLIVFDSSHISKFNFEEEENTPNFNSLTTAAFPIDIPLKPLPAPNYITGLSASIISYCSVRNLNCAIVLSIVEEWECDRVGKEAFTGFERVLGSVVNGIEGKKLKYSGFMEPKRAVLESNLYG
ncbi:hypothetical protein HK098_007906, partial [Nowakowskiella sp. JEL0407]